jgi:hypothetical protein
MAVSRRWKLAATGGLLVIVPVAWTVRHYHLLDRGSSTPLSVDEARDRYRESASTTIVATTSLPSSVPATTNAPVTTAPATTAPATTAPAPVVELPAPGVYTYTTSGRDSVDALGGAHHEYPATTTITVTSSGCGVSQRWDVLVERWELWQRCAEGDGVREVARTTYDQFFGQGQTDSYTCTGDVRPVDAEPGTTWTESCAQGDDVEVRHGEVVAREPMAVGDVTVDTLHVKVTITVEAYPSDTRVVETWYRVGSDLVVAQQAVASTTNPSPIGDVHYDESYEIHLDSLTPLT